MCCGFRVWSLRKGKLSKNKPQRRTAPVRSGNKQRLAAKRALLSRLQSQKPVGSRNSTRDELCEDG